MPASPGAIPRQVIQSPASTMRREPSWNSPTKIASHGHLQQGKKEGTNATSGVHAAVVTCPTREVSGIGSVDATQDPNDSVAANATVDQAGATVPNLASNTDCNSPASSMPREDAGQRERSQPAGDTAEGQMVSEDDSLIRLPEKLPEPAAMTSPSLKGRESPHTPPMAPSRLSEGGSPRSRQLPILPPKLMPRSSSVVQKPERTEVANYPAFKPLEPSSSRRQSKKLSASNEVGTGTDSEYDSGFDSSTCQKARSVSLPENMLDEPRNPKAGDIVLTEKEPDEFRSPKVGSVSLPEGTPDELHSPKVKSDRHQRLLDLVSLITDTAKGMDNATETNVILDQKEASEKLQGLPNSETAIEWRRKEENHQQILDLAKAIADFGRNL